MKDAVACADDKNRLATATNALTTATYTTNGRGERVRKVVTGVNPVTADYSYDEGGLLLGEYSATGTVQAEYVYLDSVPVAVAKGTSLAYIETDHLGTPRQVFDPATNNAVWTWDLLASTFGTNAPNQSPNGGAVYILNLRFHGQYYDSEAGLHYNYFRDYEPSSGRYMESDPIGIDGGMAIYTYALGAPLFYFDTLGLESQCQGCDDRVTDGKVKQWCSDFPRRIRDASLASCVKNKCQTAQVRCKSKCFVKCEGDDDYKAGNFAAVSHKGDNYITLCMNTDPGHDKLGGGWGAVIVHEFAHLCGWMHCDGGVNLGVPRGWTPAECRRAAGKDPQGGGVFMIQTCNVFRQVVFAGIGIGMVWSVGFAADQRASTLPRISDYCWSPIQLLKVDWPKVVFLQIVNDDLAIYRINDGSGLGRLYCAYPVKGEEVIRAAESSGIPHAEYRRVTD